MHIVIIGSGPVGMTAGLLLARAGHRITLVDRDAGPVAGADWERVGVMQFRLPHGFRSQCRTLLRDRLPDVYEAIVDAGAVVVAPPGAPDDAAMLSVRRSVLERSIWESASREPGISRVVGHVDQVEVVDGRAVGIVVDTRFLAADLVVDASGRAGRLSAPHRPIRRRVDCGMAYAARLYRLRPGAEPGPGAEFVFNAQHRGFLVLVFPHDHGTFTVLFVRPSEDRELAMLRDTGAFEAACRAVPGLAEWTDPERSEPIDKVRAGAGLTNEYGRQPTVAALVAIGDAVCTTNPAGGRGTALGLQSAAALADLVAADVPVGELAAELDRWSEAELLPWYEDHVDADAALLAGWAGRPVDPDGPIGLEVLVAAARDRHPEWMATLNLFFGMAVKPAALAPLRDVVRAMVRAGWQPAEPDGPTRDELAALIRAQLEQPIPA